MKVHIDTSTGYFTNIEDIRSSQYPSLANKVYLDHAGTTPYAKDLIEAFFLDLTQNLYGNPHSASESSQLSTRCIEDTRLQVLRFFNASPDDFEVIFTTNATAAIKLVADAVRDHDAGFWYGYHLDAHTSLVGVRELAPLGSRCFEQDAEVDLWLDAAGHDEETNSRVSLLAYPGQSNMTGRRRGYHWSERVQQIRREHNTQVYTLFDAAALASTSAVDLSDHKTAPDFTAVSFYKIFGFPDLGALLVRKDSGQVMQARRYFGGGTVDSVGVRGAVWHAKKTSLCARLEDGTLPFHNILALQKALQTHTTLYGSMHNTARHMAFLASLLEAQLRNLRHSNGKPVCELYSRENVDEITNYGPVLSFNILNQRGAYVRTSEVEKLGIVNGIQFRTGGLCNPGGTASHLNLSEDDLRQNYVAGHRCGNENDLIDGRPTGAVRVSLGAMSSVKDVESFVAFLKDYFVERSVPTSLQPFVPKTQTPLQQSGFVIESLSVYPIKSCAAYKIPADTPWQVGPTGLAWDREWCLVHQGTNMALNQKRYPRMALIFPTIRPFENLLEVAHNIHGTGEKRLYIELGDHSLASSSSVGCDLVTHRASNICGETLVVDHYSSEEVAGFFADALGVPCTLARFPKLGAVRRARIRVPGGEAKLQRQLEGNSILLSNESPILLISRSSVNRLNEQIKERSGGGKAISADSFRGNIVIAEELQSGQHETPYAEDDWKEIQSGENERAKFAILGPCQRCQMVCVDQSDASRRREPFNTLSKTRRRDGRVWFGMHMSLDESHGGLCEIEVGDRIAAS